MFRAFSFALNVLVVLNAVPGRCAQAQQSKCADLLLSPGDKALFLESLKDHREYQNLVFLGSGAQESAADRLAKAAALTMAEFAVKASADPDVAEFYLPVARFSGEFGYASSRLDTARGQSEQLFQIFAAAKVISAQPGHLKSGSEGLPLLVDFLMEPPVSQPPLATQAKETLDAAFAALEDILQKFPRDERRGLRDFVSEEWNEPRFPWNDYLSPDGSIKSPMEFQSMERFRMIMGIPSSKMRHPLYLKNLAKLSN